MANETETKYCPYCKKETECLPVEWEDELGDYDGWLCAQCAEVFCVPEEAK